MSHLYKFDNLHGKIYISLGLNKIFADKMYKLLFTINLNNHRL